MDFFIKCNQIRRKLRIWSHLLKISYQIACPSEIANSSAITACLGMGMLLKYSSDLKRMNVISLVSISLQTSSKHIFLLLAFFHQFSITYPNFA